MRRKIITYEKQIIQIKIIILILELSEILLIDTLKIQTLNKLNFY